MTIVAMKKATIYGLASEKPAVVAGLQELGCLHIIPLATPAPSAAREGLPHAERVYEALKYLLRTPHIRRSLRADPAFDVRRVAEEALAVRDRQREVTDRRDFLLRRIANVRKWGHFELPPLDALDGHRLWFYEVPHRLADRLKDVRLPWREVGRSGNTHLVVAISREEPPPDALPVRRTHVGAKSLRTLERELEDVEIELEDLELQRIALTRYIHLIRKNIARADDTAAFDYTLNETRDDDGVFALQAWVPEPDAPAVLGFREDRGLAVVLEPPGPDETPPTLLDNPEPVAAGEELSRFYIIPSPRDWDPSGVLLASFTIFFAMILADAGYGLLVLLGAGLFWKRLGRQRTGRHLRAMMAMLGGAAVLYGIAAGSYFGLAPPPGSLPAALDVIPERDFQTMMTLSVGIGVLHVVLANAAHAARRWPAPGALASLGWIGAALGGFLAWRGWSGDGGVLWTAGLAAIAAGLLAVFLFAGARPVRRPRDLLRRAGGGLLGLSRVTQMFGDVLSYLRLFALGLASASLAVTFNDLSAQAAASVGGVGLLLGILVAVLGHGLNFALALLGGVVHGLRLNFIEFYNWGMTEEGYLFRPFRKEESRL